jgi:hypothetical protein
MSYEFKGRTDPRMRYSREEAISVKILAERASHKVCGNGVGLKLLTDFYVGEASWWSFSTREQSLIRKTARDFARRLQAAGFIEGKGAGAGEADR